MYEKIIEWILERLPYKQVAHFLQKFLLRGKLLAAVSVILLIGSVSLLRQYYKRSEAYSDVVNATLQARLEKTPQTFKGLEAFILSKLDRNMQSHLTEATLDPEFVDQYSKLVESIEESQSKPDPQTMSDFLTTAGESETSRLLTDAGKPGFLFLPIDMVRGGYPQAAADKKNAKSFEEIVQLVGNDTEIKRDVLLSRALADNIKSFLGKQFTDKKLKLPLENLPAQVYLITGTGLNRIFSNSITSSDDANAYYAAQFSPSTFFPGRPYFQGALQQRQSLKALAPNEVAKLGDSSQIPRTVGNFFYISQPYMDLGGNGIVVTAFEVACAAQYLPRGPFTRFQSPSIARPNQYTLANTRQTSVPRNFQFFFV